jgi:hypothetical protein
VVAENKLSSSNTADLPNYDDGIFVSARQYRLLDTQIQVRFTSLAQESWVHPVLAHLECDAKSKDTTIDILCESESYWLYRQDTNYKWLCDRLDKLAPLVKGLVLQAAINNHDYLFNIHAGVVCNGRHCILLPAAAGSGKTSLTAALVYSGFYYFSDEIALLDETTFKVRAVPISLCVKSTGLALLQSYYPQLTDLRVNIREDGKLVSYLPPPPNRLWPVPEQSVAVSAIIFPRYSPSVTTTMQPISKIDALNRLFKECMVLPKKLDRKKIAELIEWIKTVDCYELPFCSLDQANSLIDQAYRK